MATWNLENTSHHLLLCNGSSCNRGGAEDLTAAIRKEISSKNLDDQIHTTRTLCMGRCYDQCVVVSYPEGYWFKEMTTEDVPYFIESLHTSARLADKISHSYEGNSFQAKAGTISGIDKTKARVKKASKL